MYFWRIEDLKTKMVASPLSEREVLPYLVVFIVASTAIGYFPKEFDLWENLSAACSFIITIAGTIYIYKKNGGSEGKHLLQRYLVIGWVVGIRYLVGILVATLICFGFLMFIGLYEDTEVTQWYEFVFFAIAEFILYWRIGHNIEDIVMRTKTDQTAALP